MEVIYCSSAYEAKNRAKESLRSFLTSVKESGKSVLLLLSGGSAFEILQEINRSVLGKYITCSVLDERYSKDKTVNNFAQLLETEFYARAKAAGAAFIDTRIQNKETAQNLALRFEGALKKWRKKYPNDTILATMGIGVDGHTAGIIPFPENPARFCELFEDKRRWVVAYDAGDKNPYSERVTVTLPFLRNLVDTAIVYAVGEEKKEALARVVAEEGILAETPARILREMKNASLYWG